MTQDQLFQVSKALKQPEGNLKNLCNIKQAQIIQELQTRRKEYQHLEDCRPGTSSCSGHRDQTPSRDEHTE